jgi:hypothetical protein
MGKPMSAVFIGHGNPMNALQMKRTPPGSWAAPGNLPNCSISE